MNGSPIEHLLVLMLENRSFDHMLGYLEYPPEAGFDGVRGREATMRNPLPNGEVVFPSPNARYAVHPGPGHSHDDVMEQLLGSNDRSTPYRCTNNGFAANYETRYNSGHGAMTVECFAPEALPIMARLAKEFAVCDRWFCSVPGATWPNRNFCHAATSDGEVNIHARAYHNKTIFEQLSEAGRDWAVYYGGFPPQSIAFSRLWQPNELNWLQRYKPIEQLYRAIRFDRLPHYAFIEPDMVGKLSDSQHPGMGGEMDFRAAERLIWRIYSALREQPEVFEKTLLVITYDEHGGFFDHVAPPQGPEWAVDDVYRSPDGSYTFPFDMLGLRVPAILISPWIEAGTVDHTVYDHSSIMATARKLLGVHAAPLTNRDAATGTFEHVLRRTEPRSDLPELKEPFVDEAARRLIEEPDLRNSLIDLLVDVIWTELRPGRRGPVPRGGAPETPELAELPLTPEEVERDIMTEIAPQLSPEAQRVLAEATAEAESAVPRGAVPRNAAEARRFNTQSILSMLRHQAERLAENLSLVDDLMSFVDKVLRRYWQGHQVILRTASGLSIEQPGEAALRGALEELFAQPHEGARVWLADYQDRWLTAYDDGRVTLHDQEPSGIFVIDEVNPGQVVEMFRLLAEGDVPRLRSLFT